ncbi:MAG: potassium channel family protein, partial [Verrucomicrobiota bacterium]
WFLAAIAVLFVVTPVIEMLPDGHWLASIIVTLSLVAAVFAVGGSRIHNLTAGILVTPVVIGWWLQHHRSDGFPFLLFGATLLIFISYVIARFILFILKSPKVNSEVLSAGIVTYLMLAVWWSTAYSLVGLLVPNSFGGLPAHVHRLYGFDALYFSVITLTTVGYGEILPLSMPARMLAMMEALCGTLYVAVFVARLVSLNTSLSPVVHGSDPVRPGPKS